MKVLQPLSIFILIFNFVLLFFNCSEAVERETSWNEVFDQVGEEVCLRGFIYQKSDSEWILAADPHLHSCCIGNFEKSPQLLLDGNFPTQSPIYAVVVQGQVKKSQDSFLYYLSNAKLIEKKNSSYSWAIASLLLGFIIVIILTNRTSLFCR